MEKRKISSEGYFRVLLMLTGAMAMSQVTMIMAFVYVVLSGETPPDPATMEILIYVTPAVVCTAFGASFVLPSMLINKAADKPTLAEKLRGFQTASIIRLALLEAPAILAAITFMLSGEYYWLAVNLVSIGLIAMNFPSRAKTIDALRLSGPDAALVNDPKAIVMEVDTTTD